MSSTPSSNRSYSDQEVSQYMLAHTDHYTDILKSFKVADLDRLLIAKNKRPRGVKADKVQQVSWCYTPAEIQDAKRQLRAEGLPAILQRVVTLDHYF